MKKLISIIAAALMPLTGTAQNFSKINDLPIRNSPVGTDSIPASDASGATWRIQFSKFGAGGGGGGSLPDMTGNANKLLTNNGTIASWTATPTVSLVNATGLPLATGISGFDSGAAAFLGTASSANLRTLMDDEVGTGALYFVGGALGAPTITLTNATGTPTSIGLANGTGLPASGIGSGTIAQARLGTGSDGTGNHFLADDQTYKSIAGGGDALTANGLGQFAATPSASFAGVISDETGTDKVVLSASPQLTGSPILGLQPSSSRYAITGTGGNGYIDLNIQTSAPSTPSTGFVRMYSNASGQLAWKTSANAFAASIATSSLTADRGYIAANKNGTIMVGDDTNLSGGTALAVGVHYFDTLSAGRTLTFSGTPVAGGNSTILRANVTVASTINFPASIRVASTDSTPITTLTLPVGPQILSWNYSNGAWYLLDTVPDSSGLVPETRTVAGHPLSSDVTLEDDDLVFTDNTSNNATIGQHGYLKKLSNNAAQYMDGSGNWTTPSGTGVPTGTGFYHITSGVQDAAAVAETGTGSVVRNIAPAIQGLDDSASLFLSGTITATITADQNNWLPTGLSGAFSIRTDATTTDRTITGIATGTNGRMLAVSNISSTANITLADESSASTATSRFAFGGSNVILSPNKVALLRYDSGSNRWRLLGGTQLAGDVAAPGNFKFYGTNSAGAKGYQDLAPDTINLFAGGGSGDIVDAGIDPATVITSETIGTLTADATFEANVLDHTDVDIATVLSGSTYTLVPGTAYYGDITGNKTFAFSPTMTVAHAPTTFRAHVTGTGTWTVPTLIREGANGSTTTVAVDSLGYFTATFLKVGSGNIRLIDDIPTLQPVTIGIAASDETTALTTGTAKATFRMPYAMTVSGVRATLTTAQASGSIFTVDINDGGTTILSTKLTVDNTEKTSTTAAAAAVISDTALADDAEITVDIDQIGTSGATGIKIWLIGGR